MTINKTDKTGTKRRKKLIGSTSIILLGVAMVLVMPAAHAAGLDAIAERLSKTAGSLAWLMQVIFVLIGIGLIAGGILGFITDAKQKGNGPVSKGAAAIMVLGGGLLAFMGSLVETTGDTVWGDGKGDRGRIEISE